MRKKKITSKISRPKELRNISSKNLKVINSITRIVTSYDYDKYGRTIGTRKEVWSSDRPALTARTTEKYEYDALGRKQSTTTETRKEGIDVDASEISNVVLDAQGRITSYDYTKDGTTHHVSNITYYEDGPYKDYIASYTESDGTETVIYSDMTYDETGTLISFTKTLPDGTKEYHSITRDENGEITEYVIRDEDGQIISSFTF